MPQVAFAAQSYQSRALDISAQRLVNYYAEKAPDDGKSKVLVYNAPGTKAFGAGGLAGAIRGAKAMGGVLYIVAGNTFYSVASTGVATSIGTINTSIGNISMAANLASPQELCFVDGTDGWTYDTSNGLRQIVDAQFVAADTVAFQDQYFIFNEAGTSNWFISALNDGRTYATTDFASAESSPDNVVVVASNHGQVWVFGQETIEVYYNSGNADFPFERVSGLPIERGCAAAFSVAEEDNTLFWLGDDWIVYRANGFTPQRISTHAIEEAIRKYTDRSDAIGFFVTVSGHKFYHLIFPTGGACFVFDIATGLWHERESFGARYWRAIGYVFIYDKHIVGDAFQGRLGELDMDTFAEYGSTMQGILTAPVVHKDRKRVFHKRLEIDIESGVGDTSGTYDDPQMWIEWSDDGGRSWSARKPLRAMGKIGEYMRRLRWVRLGAARNRVYRLTVADQVKRSIVGAYLEAGEGTH